MRIYRLKEDGYQRIAELATKEEDQLETPLPDLTIELVRIFG